MCDLLVASDWDRTLTSERDRFVIREEVAREVNEFSKLCEFVVVTGREERFRSVLAKNLSPTGWIMENGALIIRSSNRIVNADRSWFRTRETICEELRKMGIRYSKGEVILYVDKPGFDLKIGEASVDWNWGDAMIMPRGLNKGFGLKVYIKAINFRGKVIAVGDGENDLSMFSVADFKVAVANAVPEVKREADLVLSREDGEGVVELLKMIRNGSIP